jgi:hypothetical protein
MGWKRINGRSYYYRSAREGGRVRTEYVGAGEVASLIAQADTIERDRREAERRDWEAERQRAAAEDRELDEWFDGIGSIADAAMIAAGFHKHKGQWRRRRDGGDREEGRADSPRGDRPR